MPGRAGAAGAACINGLVYVAGLTGLAGVAGVAGEEGHHGRVCGVEEQRATLEHYRVSELPSMHFGKEKRVTNHHLIF